MSPQLFSRRRHSVVMPLCLLASVLALSVVGVVSGTGQDDSKQEREIEDRIPAHLPVKFKVKNPEKAKDLKNDDWLRDIEIEVKNTGTKPVYFLRFSVAFVDVRGYTGKQIGYPLSYGRFDMIVIDERAKPEDVPIMPGEVHVFKVSRSYVEGWNSFKAKENKPQPKKIGFIFHELNFGDGTGFLGTGGDPIPSKKSSAEGKGDNSSAGYTERQRPPRMSLHPSQSYLPATFLPVNFYPVAAGDSMPGRRCLRRAVRARPARR